MKYKNIIFNCTVTIHSQVNTLRKNWFRLSMDSSYQAFTSNQHRGFPKKDTNFLIWFINFIQVLVSQADQFLIFKVQGKTTKILS